MILSLRNALGTYTPARCSNKSLLFHRLTTAMDEPDRREHQQKEQMLQDLCHPYSRDTLRAYKKALAHWRALEGAETQMEFFVMTLTSRLICGMGNKGVQECGATFLPPWGVPCIPGSAVKGVASTYAHLHGGGVWQKSRISPSGFRPGGENALVLFGGNETRAKSLAAGLDILDAWWLPGNDAAPFEEDILTPHNGDYLIGRNGVFRPPDGTESPIPVSFPVIKAGQRFLFGLRGPESLRRTAKDILRMALAEEGPGLGGKTRLGYGRFVYEMNEQERLEWEQQEQQRLEREREERDRQRRLDKLKNFLQLLLGPEPLTHKDARKRVAAEKLTAGLDMTHPIVGEIHAAALRRFPDRASAADGWIAKFAADAQQDGKE